MKTRTTFTLIGLIGIGLLTTSEAFARGGTAPARASGAAHAKACGQKPVDAKAKANPADPGVNARQHRQHARTESGVRSGQLTRGETRGIAKERQAIRKEERQYKSDGTLTRAERKDLHQDLNAASKEIYQEKHDTDVRPKTERKDTDNKLEKKWKTAYTDGDGYREGRFDKNDCSGDELLSKSEAKAGSTPLERKLGGEKRFDRAAGEDGMLSKGEAKRELDAEKEAYRDGRDTGGNARQEN